MTPADLLVSLHDEDSGLKATIEGMFLIPGFLYVFGVSLTLPQPSAFVFP